MKCGISASLRRWGQEKTRQTWCRLCRRPCHGPQTNGGTRPFFKVSCCTMRVKKAPVLCLLCLIVESLKVDYGKKRSWVSVTVDCTRLLRCFHCVSSRRQLWFVASLVERLSVHYGKLSLTVWACPQVTTTWAREHHEEGHETLHDIYCRNWESQQSQYCVASAPEDLGGAAINADDPHPWKCVKGTPHVRTLCCHLFHLVPRCWCSKGRCEDRQAWRYSSPHWTAIVEERIFIRMKHRSRPCHKLLRDERRLCASHSDRTLTWAASCKIGPLLSIVCRVTNDGQVAPFVSWPSGKNVRFAIFEN